MKTIYSFTLLGIILLGMSGLISCKDRTEPEHFSLANEIKPIEVRVEAEDLTHSNKPYEVNTLDSSLVYVETYSDGWIALNVNITVAGRYKIEIKLSANPNESVTCWVEDHYDKKGDRIYNITGDISMSESTSEFTIHCKDGSPLNSGLHRMKVHFNQPLKIDWINFRLMKKHEFTSRMLTQKTDGSEWKIVWADEFDGSAVDTTKWTYDIGNWGWGDNELQYYTEGRTENARIENGNLIIEAIKDNEENTWTSARLTTRGKVSFLYGKIEFRAKVPSYRGNWAAGWTLGDEYVDELSLPYCGKIDILESVGYEMDDITGNGIAHASTHRGAYYFKVGNQPTGVVEVANMNNAYHTYAVEWKPDGIKEFVDDRLYASYTDRSTDLSWPFSKPQNIILNLAIGGGWAGMYGLDENVNSQKMIIDYVRVYELH